MHRHVLFSLALTSFLTSSLHAAEPRTEIARQPMLRAMPSVPAASSSSDQGELVEPMPKSEAASEFGEQVIMMRRASWNPWHVETGIEGYFTDNVALAPKRVEDFFLKYGAAASYTNRIGGAWSMDVSMSQDFVRYDQFDSLDFDLLHLSSGLGYQASWLGDATFLLRYNFYRLTEAGFGSELMTSHSLTVAMQKVWQLSRGQQFFIGASSEPGLATDPDVVLRHEHALFVGYSARLTNSLTAAITGRAGYHVSPNSNRDDWNYAALASLTYAITDWVRVGATSSISWNESNHDIYTYRNVLAGVFVSLQLNF